MTNKPHIRAASGVTFPLHLLLSVALLFTVSCRPYEAAWRTTAGVKAAAEITDKAIASAAMADHDRCKTAHGVANAAYRKCMDSARGYQAMVKWRKFGKPAINGSLIAAVAALQIAEHASGSKVNWLVLLKPAACALAGIVKQFGDLMGQHKAAVMVAVAMVQGVSCESN